MMVAKSPWDGYGGDKGGNVTRLPFVIKAARLPDPEEIPPRAWLYGTLLLRGYVSLLVSPGGVGKSQVAMAIAASLAANYSLLGHRIHHRVNSWLFNLEDPLEEMERRLAGIMIHHSLDASHLHGRLFMTGAEERGLCIAKMDDDGSTFLFPDRDAVISAARSADIGCIVVDPFVRSHALVENNNSHMDAAVSAWSQVAQTADCSILIVHHVRKGPVTDIDSARGGSALKDAARSAVLLSTMTAEEAEQLGVPVADRWRHVRLDSENGKSNMSPPGQADWLVMHPVDLNNGNSLYPNGDTVTALAKWVPADPWAGITKADCNRVLDIIAKGPREGTLYCPTKRGANNARWAGLVLIEELSITEGFAKHILAEWMKNGVIIPCEYHDKGDRKDRTGVRVVDAHRPT